MHLNVHEWAVQNAVIFVHIIQQRDGEWRGRISSTFPHNDVMQRAISQSALSECVCVAQWCFFSKCGAGQRQGLGAESDARETFRAALQPFPLSDESLGRVVPWSSSNSVAEARSEGAQTASEAAKYPASRRLSAMMSLVSGMMSLAANQTRANETPGGPAHRTFCPRWRSQLWNEVMQRKVDCATRAERLVRAAASEERVWGWKEVQRIRF